MEALREGLAHIPDSISTLITSLPSTSSMLPSVVKNFRPSSSLVDDLSSPSKSQQSSMSGEETYSDKAIPGSLINEECQLVLDQVNYAIYYVYLVNVNNNRILLECFRRGSSHCC